MPRTFRIFISSPGDVVPERRRAALVVEKLSKEYRRFFSIEPELWETEPQLASGHFQDAIVPPGEVDIVVIILWSRLGTALPQSKYRGTDGRTPVTGTEWEFETALAAHAKTGAPDLLAYKKKIPPRAEFRSAAEAAELGRQLEKLEAFWRRYFANRGEFLAAYTEFETLDDFDERLESDLRRLIDRRISGNNQRTDEPKAEWLTSSPFRGLESYNSEHAPIFFGRSEAIKTSVERLVESADEGLPFLLILGASGSGKSSLALAGIVPVLRVRGIVPSAGGWRIAVTRPGAHESGPFAALAAALGENPALPELSSGQDARGLAKHLQVAAAEPGFPIVAALLAREKDDRAQGKLLTFEEYRLILVVDQLEELFNLGGMTAVERSAFVTCLKGLAATGRVFVIVTMRSDYWHRAAEVPELIAMAEGRRRFDLLPPTQSELTEMIRRPAQAAGILYEVDARNDIPLDSKLAEEAASEPGALPLVSFLLDALYAEDIGKAGRSSLTYETMRTLGGLKGAIAMRAEAALAALPSEVQAALPSVLRALVTVSGPGAEPAARRAPMSQFAPGSAEAQLVAALLQPQIRLLLAEGGGDGGLIRVAHESLITHWRRARQLIAQERDDFRTRTAVEDAEAQWSAASSRDKRGYLLRDPLLARALHLATRWSLSPPLLSFIDASCRRARLVQRLITAAAVVFGCVAVAASAAGVLAYRAEQTARVERDKAESERARADAELAQAQINESMLAAHFSGQQIDAGNSVTAALVALEGLNENPGTRPRPYVPDAELQLERAWRTRLERSVLAGHHDSVVKAVFSPDDARVLSLSADHTARLWDTRTGHQTQILIGHLDRISSATFSPDGTTIVTTSADDTARLWDARTGAMRVLLAGHEDAVNAGSFSPDGGRVVTAADDNSARVWDAVTGREVLALRGHSRRVADASFSPDGQRVLTASADATARLWDARTGDSIFVLEGHAGPLASATFSRDGKLVLTASDDTTARVWNAATGALVALLAGHEDAVTNAVFSSSGARIATASSDKTARVWDGATGLALNVLAGHAEAVNAVGFTADGARIATASDDGSAVVWDAQSGKRLVTMPGHGAKLVSAVFSSTGDRLVTASFDGTARLWDLQATGAPTTLASNEGSIADVAIAPDGRRIVTVPANGNLDLWDAVTYSRMSTFAGFDATRALFSPDGAAILAGSSDGTVRLVDAIRGNVIATWRAHAGAIHGIAFFQRGSQIATASADGTARLWDRAGGRVRAILRGHEDWVTSVTVSRDDRLIATTSDDSTTRLWLAQQGQQIHVLRHPARVLDSAFSPEGAALATASTDGIARIWDSASGRELAALRGHRGPITRLVFMPDGKRLVTASTDQSVRVWDIATRSAVAVLTGHDDAVNSITVSEDGNRLFSVSADGTVRIWTIFPDTASLKAAVETGTPRCLSAAERQSFFVASRPASWCLAAQKWPYDRSQEDAPLIARGREHLLRQEHSEAIAVLEDVVRRDRSVNKYSGALLAAALNGRAWRSYLSQNYQAGFEDAVRALALAPTDHRILDTRGHILLALNRPDAALADFTQAIVYGRRTAGTFYGRAQTHERKGQVDLAVADYERALTSLARNEYSRDVQSKSKDRLRSIRGVR